MRSVVYSSFFDVKFCSGAGKTVILHLKNVGAMRVRIRANALGEYGHIQVTR